jgi:hypothetical protein
MDTESQPVGTVFILDTSSPGEYRHPGEYTDEAGRISAGGFLENRQSRMQLHYILLKLLTMSELKDKLKYKN